MVAASFAMGGGMFTDQCMGFIDKCMLMSVPVQSAAKILYFSSALEISQSTN